MDAEQFHLENQSGVRRNRAGIAGAAVGEFRRDGHLHFVADFHGGHTQIPHGDDLSCAEDERERFVRAYYEGRWDEVRKTLAANPTPEAIRQAARKEGMKNLQEEGVLLVAKGVTSLPELMRVLKQ